MRVWQRLSVGVCVLFLLATLLCVSVSWRSRRVALRQSRYQSQLDHEAQKHRGLEAAKVASGQLWVGELHPPALTAQPETEAGSDLIQQRRIAGDLRSQTATISAQFELHECQPGSAKCSAGGNVVVSADGQPLATIAVGIMQAGQSHYRVDWLPGTALSDAEKFDVLQELAGDDAQPSDYEQLNELARDVFGQAAADQSSDDVQRQQELVRSILCSIIKSKASGESVHRAASTRG